MEKIILIGGGGHCKVIIDTLFLEKSYEIVGIVDIKKRVGEEVSGIPIIGTDKELNDYFKKGIKSCFIAIGSVGNSHLRTNLFDTAKQIGFKFPNIIHPRSIISRFSEMGEGNYVAAGAIINVGVNIGNNCIINTGVIIDHDCKIADSVHIAPGTVISGAVEIDKYSFIGTGSSILQCLKIGKNTVIGAGSVVVRDIGDNIVAYGNPCKKIRGNNV